MIYRVHCHHSDDGSLGYTYFGNAQDAKRALSEWKRDASASEFSTIESAPTPTTKAEILALLTLWASHSDNG